MKKKVNTSYEEGAAEVQLTSPPGTKESKKDKKYRTEESKG